MLERRGKYELKAGEEVLMYTKFGQWLPDDVQIKKALGQLALNRARAPH